MDRHDRPPVETLTRFNARPWPVAQATSNNLLILFIADG